MRDADDMDGPFVERMLPRSLLVPPGIPDFLTRERHLAAGPVTLQGRAWSGQAPVERVEVSDDGGATWADAELEPPLGPYAWRGFSFEWDATPGEHELCCRATDAAGNTQPLEPEWNYGGFCNNGVQRIRVLASLGATHDPSCRANREQAREQRRGDPSKRVRKRPYANGGQCSYANPRRESKSQQEQERSLKSLAFEAIGRRSMRRGYPRVGRQHCVASRLGAWQRLSRTRSSARRSRPTRRTTSSPRGRCRARSTRSRSPAPRVAGSGTTTASATSTSRPSSSTSRSATSTRSSSRRSRSRRTSSARSARRWRPSRSRRSRASSRRSRPATSRRRSSRTAAPRRTRTRSSSRAGTPAATRSSPATAATTARPRAR